MDFQRYIGYGIDEVEALLRDSNIKYFVVELFDTKNTKIGNDRRIINICEDNNNLILYVAYF